MKYLLSVTLFSLALCFASAQANPGASTTPSSIVLSQPDFNGDGQAELVFRRIDNDLISVVSSEGRTDFITRFGRLDSDMPVIGDFDGDGITDLAVRRLSSATWKVKNSSGSNYNSVLNNGEQWVIFGRQKQDIPTVGDYDGDGISDFAVFRPETQMWYIRNSSLNNYNSAREDGIQRIQLGDKATLIPVPGDYDGDSITDMAIFDAETSQWLIRYSSQPLTPITVRFGSSIHDIPVVADYDGDGKTDIAIWDRETLSWGIKESSTEQVRYIPFGYYPTDIPIVADYDGDGLADPALRDLSDIHVYIINSSDNQLNSFRVGGFDDIPVNAPAYLVMRMIQDRDIMLDTDGDGISDKAEVEIYGTNPYLSDSDGDGLSDFDEVNLYNTEPLDADTDNDGVEDGDEVSITTDPNDPDSVSVPRATTQVNMTVNLPAAASPIDANHFDPDNPVTYHASTSIEIYDSLGNPHTQTFYFVKDANAPTVNEWLIATSIDDIFYDFANFDGSVPGVGVSNSHGNIAAVPPTLPDASSNILGFSQTLPVDDGSGQIIIRNTGYWATRVIFNSSGELIEIQSADGNSLPVVFSPGLNVSTDGFLPIPTTIPLTGFRNPQANKNQTIGLEMHFESDAASGFKPTQYALPFEVFNLSHNGLPGFRGENPYLVDTDGDGLSDFAELHVHSTAPLQADTDGDGVNDGVEVKNGTNPAKDNSFSAPVATSVVTMRMNLPAGAALLNANNFNPNDDSTFTGSSTIDIYDSLGNAHTQTFYFLKDANAPTANEWLMVTAIDGMFYDFLNSDGSVTYSGYSNSPRSFGAVPRVPPDFSNNTVGFSQNLPVFDGFTAGSRNTGVWATRLFFDTSGDLVLVESADGVSVPGLSVSNLSLPTTNSPYHFWNNGAEANSGIKINFNLNYNAQSADEPTQSGFPFEVFTVSQDGRAAFSQQ